MALSAEKTSYTFADFLLWDEGDRIEIINGEAFLMATPSRIHQKIAGELFRQIANFLEGKQCEVYSAPFSVRLFEKDGDGILQPYEVYRQEDIGKVNVLEGCFIELGKVFSEFASLEGNSEGI